MIVNNFTSLKPSRIEIWFKNLAEVKEPLLILFWISTLSKTCTFTQALETDDIYSTRIPLCNPKVPLRTYFQSIFSHVTLLQNNFIMYGRYPPCVTWCVRCTEQSFPITNKNVTSLLVQWLRLCASNAGGKGSVPGWWMKIPHDAQLD